jgi:hypothetical protein
MQPGNRVLAHILTYLGTLPLVLSAAMSMVGHHEFNYDQMALTYGAVIVSFLSGIHWATYLFYSERCPRNLLLTSNMAALLAWLSLLIASYRVMLFLQMLCFLYLLTLDLKLLTNDVFPQWFYALRRNATAIVVISLSVLMLFV